MESSRRQHSAEKQKKTKVKQRPYHHGDLRKALLDAALEILAKEGESELTLREVARRAGVTHAAPYRHFPNKEALLASVAEEGFRMLVRHVDEARAGVTDPALRLQTAGVGYVMFAVSHPIHFRVMFRAVQASGASFPSLAEAGAAAFSQLLESVVECQQAGVVVRGEPRELAISAWAIVHGLASLLMDNCLGPTPPNVTPTTLAMQVNAHLMQGLRPRSA